MYLSTTSNSRINGKLTRLLVFVFVIASLLPHSYARDIALPEIGDPSGRLLTPAQERRVGEAFMRNIRANMKVISDPLSNSYIQGLGERLLSSSEFAGQTFHFFLVDNPSINAFAGPAGYIGVNTGLIKATESESELASVLAHEITHVTQKHLLRRYDALSRMSVPAAALTIAALVLGAASENPDMGLAAASGIQAGILQKQINYTRANEEEADRIGIQILANADFDPNAMPLFFYKLGKSSRLYDSGELPEFLRTHPVTTNRIADAQARAAAYPPRQRPDSLGYHLLRTNIRLVQFEDAQTAVNYFRQTLSDGRYRNKTAQRYGYVRSLIWARHYSKAKRELQILKKSHPDKVDFIILDAKLAEKSGNSSESISILKSGLDLYPGNNPLSLYYGRMLLDQQRPKKALQLLEEQLRNRSGSTQLYSLLARAAGDSGKETLGHQYLAEYHYLLGSYKAATRQIRIALDDQSLTYYQRAKLTARLKEIEQEMRDIQKS